MAIRAAEIFGVLIAMIAFSGYADELTAPSPPKMSIVTSSSSYCAAPIIGYGFGRHATGGCNVVHVTSLLDPLPWMPQGVCPDRTNCTLRAAATKANSYVVFDVSGTIVLNEKLVPAASVTIDGSSTPRPGIWITNTYEHTTAGQIDIHNNNIILTQLRFRPSVFVDSNSRCINIANGQDILIDHVSCAWPYDEGIAMAGYTYPDHSDSIRNVTVQYSILAEGLNPQSHSTLHDGDVGNITWFQNLFSSTRDRNAKFCPGNPDVNDSPSGLKLTCNAADLTCGTFEIIQNFVYNFTYGLRLTSRSPSFVAKFDIVQNYFKAGPIRSFTSNEKLPIFADNVDGYSDPAHLHIFQLGNLKDYPRAGDTGQQCDNFGILSANINECAGLWSRYDAGKRQITDHALPESLTAIQARDRVLITAGAQLPCMDTEDRRILSDAKNNTGPRDWLSSGNFIGSKPLPILKSIGSRANPIVVIAGVDSENEIGGGAIQIDNEIINYSSINTLSSDPVGYRRVELLNSPKNRHATGAVIQSFPLRPAPLLSGPICAP